MGGFKTSIPLLQSKLVQSPLCSFAILSLHSVSHLDLGLTQIDAKTT